MMWSRRRFLGQGSMVAAMGTIWGCAQDSREQLPGAQTKPQTTPLPGGPHTILASPGPMIPPVPAVLLTINGADGEPDEISVLWTFVVSGSPPQIGVSAATEHRARGLLELHSEFVLNLPVATMVEAFDTADMNSGRTADKFELTGLTRGRAVAVDAPTIEESPIHCECRIIASLDVPPERKLFIAEVVATTVSEGAVDSEGRLKVGSVPFFGMTSGSGEHYTMGDRIGNIGMTVGRTDIKY